MSDTMRAVDIKNGTGPATSLFISTTIPKPTLTPTTAIIHIKAFGLNRMDLLQREGNYPLPPQAGPILGVEFSGVITEIGEEVVSKEGFAVGDEVFGLAYGGAYAEYIRVDPRMLLRKPGHLSWEEAAGIPETWITATQALFLIGEFAAGKSVLWHAGASSVSIAGIQLSKLASASAIYATASSQEKLDFCTSTLGATAGFNYKTQDFASEILKVSDGKGVDVVIDFVGQSYFQQNLTVAARDGRVVLLGYLSGPKLPEGVNIGAFIAKRLRVEGSSLRSRDVKYQGKLRDKLEEYLPRFEDGSLKVFVEKVLPWTEIVQAHQLMEGNATKGKIICTVDW